MAWFDIVGGLAEGLGQSAQMGLADIAKRRQLEEEKLNEALSRILPGSELTPEMAQQVLNSPKLGKAFVGYDSKTKKPYLLPTEAQRRAEVQAFANSDPDATFDEPEARRLQRFGITPQMMTQKDGGLYSRTPTRAEAQSAEDRLTARAEDLVSRVQPGQLIPVTPESKKAAELYPGLFTMGPNNQYQVNQFGPVALRAEAAARQQMQDEVTRLGLAEAQAAAAQRESANSLYERYRANPNSLSMPERIMLGRTKFNDENALLSAEELLSRNPAYQAAKLEVGAKPSFNDAYKEKAAEFLSRAFATLMTNMPSTATPEEQAKFSADAFNRAIFLTERVYPGALPRPTVTPSGQNQSSSNSQNSLGQKSSATKPGAPVASSNNQHRLYPPPVRP
jgi:hypothetical protein